MTEPSSTRDSGNTTSPSPGLRESSEGIRREVLIGLGVGLVVVLLLSLALVICLIRRSYRMSRKKRRKGVKYAEGSNPAPELDRNKNGNHQPVSKGSQDRSAVPASLFENIKKRNTETQDDFREIATIKLESSPDTSLVPNPVAKFSKDVTNGLNTRTVEHAIAQMTSEEVHGTHDGRVTFGENVSSGDVERVPSSSGPPEDCRLSWEYQYQNQGFTPDMHTDGRTNAGENSTGAPVAPKRSKKRKHPKSLEKTKEISSASSFTGEHDIQIATDLSGNDASVQGSNRNTPDSSSSPRETGKTTNTEPVPMVSPERHDRLRELVCQLESPAKPPSEEFSLVDLHSHDYEFENDCAYSAIDSANEDGFKDFNETKKNESDLARDKMPTKDDRGIKRKLMSISGLFRKT